MTNGVSTRAQRAAWETMVNRRLKVFELILKVGSSSPNQLYTIHRGYECDDRQKDRQMNRKRKNDR